MNRNRTNPVRMVSATARAAWRRHLPGDAAARLDPKRHGRGLHGHARARHAVGRRPSAGRSPRPRRGGGSGSDSTPTLMTARRSVSISSSSRSWEMTRTAAPLAASVIRAWWIGGRGTGIHAPGRLGDHQHAWVLQRPRGRPRTSAGCRPKGCAPALSMPGVRTSNSLTITSRELPRLAGFDEAAGEQALALAAAEHAIVDQAHVRHRGMAVALLGHAAQASARRRVGPSWPTALPSMRIDACRASTSARRRAPAAARSGRCRRRRRCRRSRRRGPRE